MTTTKKLICGVLVTFTMFVVTYTNASAFQQQTDSQSRPNTEDPIQQLNLTPEQREKIRSIREQVREERAAINQRLKETNQALQKALDADNPDEAQLENLMRDVSAAQAAAMRLRILNEVRIRRVLTPEQIAIWRGMRREAQLERRMDNVRRRQEAFDEQRRLGNPRSSVRPLFPRIAPQRRPRP